jgi:hypothetical protein
MLDFRSGGGLLLLAVALVVLAVVWFASHLRGSGGPALGDGRSVESYGFDLAHLKIPRETIVAAGVARDQIRPLDHPATLTAAGVAAFNAEHRGKYIVPDDRVIGVVLGGQARAYPVRLLNWHEVLNDTLGGIPIVVTYSPLCASVAVFDRRVGDETLTFGTSGLLHDSNLILYDRREGGGESLWVQLRAEAVAGPAARRGARLRLLPASLATWEHWLRHHPETTVPGPELAWLKQYQSDPYGNYYLTGKPRFPVDPWPSEEGWPPMHRVLVVEDPAGRRVVPLGPGRPAPDSAAELEAAAGIPLSVESEGALPSLIVDPGAGTPVLYSLWFAWYAQHPDG